MCNRSASLQQVGRCAAVFHALADQDDRPLGREQHVDGLGHAFGIGAAAAGDVGVPVFRLRGFLGRGFLEDIERDVEHDRSRPSRHHGLPGLPDRERDHVAARRLEHALAIGAHGRGKVRLIVAVELLERAAIELAGRHVAGHRQERHRIEIGVAERDRQIGRAGAAGGEGRGRLAADAVVHVRHEAGDGLVMHRDGLDVAERS